MNRRDAIYKIEDALLALEEHVECPVEHTFGPGFYARTMTIPAGTLLTGKVHATEHIFFISKGEILLATEDGSVRASAGFQAVCRPGMKRVGLAITETVVTNVHITELTDLAAIEAAVIAPQALEMRHTETLEAA